MSQVLAVCTAGFRFVLVYFSSCGFICCFVVKDCDLSETLETARGMLFMFIEFCEYSFSYLLQTIHRVVI